VLKENEALGIALVGGPFKHMSGGWIFQKLGDAGSKVKLDLQFEFESRATDIIFGRFFENTCNSLIDPFTHRAAKIDAGLKSFLPWRTSRNCRSSNCRKALQVERRSRGAGSLGSFPILISRHCRLACGVSQPTAVTSSAAGTGSSYIAPWKWIPGTRGG